MDNKKLEEIKRLDREIDNIALQGTTCYDFKKEKHLNYYDKKIIEYYGEILNLIVEIASEENIKDIKLIDDKFKNWVNTASQMLESYISVLQFYRQFDKEAIKEEINALKKIKDNLKLDYEFEVQNAVQVADCYFYMGNEEKARNLMLEFIKNNSDEDEPYQCMQNWYMYDKPDINKLAEVIDLAEENNHILLTDFGYDRLVNYYKETKDNKNYKKYQELYEKWKESRETISF